MPVWALILIAIAVVTVIAAAAWMAWSKRRTGQLKSRFGPEYDRTIAESGGRRKAESELDSRRKRREQLDIRPLSAADGSRETCVRGRQRRRGRHPEVSGPRHASGRRLDREHS